MIREKPVAAFPGWPVIGAIFALLIIGTLLTIAAGAGSRPIGVIAGLTLIVVGLLGLPGFFLINPNEAKVVQLLGRYVGTARQPGLWWMNPLCYPKTSVSQRVRNFESSKLKVNDHDGNPIDIAAVVVWNVIDTAEALFQVDDYENFVRVQSEAAIRNLATSYPYDAQDESRVVLRRSSGEITEKLRSEIQERLAKAGIEVIEARISHLAYAQEIAGAMLRRQQASAIIAAKALLVEGAVGIVESALDELAKKHVVDLDNERKVAMVSNLLVVLCSDQHPQPVVNTGTLYQ